VQRHTCAAGPPLAWVLAWVLDAQNSQMVFGPPLYALHETTPRYTCFPTAPPRTSAEAAPGLF
jgi:hypothetical protein